MSAHPLKLSFPPVVTPGMRVLILGSLPGDASLAAGEYYAHPQNRFWRVLATIAGVDPPAEYRAKLKVLESLNTGLWDVVGRAARHGSLDSSISDPEPNALDQLIAEHPTLTAIGFNGAASKRIFDRHFNPVASIRYLALPSTSPANARFDLERLVAEWSGLFDQIQTNTPLSAWPV